MSDTNLSSTLADLAVSAKPQSLNELLRDSLSTAPLGSTPVNISIDASKLTGEELSLVLAAQLSKGGAGLGLLKLTPQEIQSASGIPYLQYTLEAIFKKNGVESRNADGSFRPLKDLLTEIVKRDGEPALYRLIPKPILELLGGAAIAYDLAATGGQSVKQLGLSATVFESIDSTNRNNFFKLAVGTSSVGSMPVAASMSVGFATGNAPDPDNLARGQNLANPFKPPVGPWAISTAEVEANDGVRGKLTVITGLDSVRLTLSAVVGSDPAKNEFTGAIAIGSGISLTGSLGKTSAVGASYAVNSNLSIGAELNNGGGAVKVSGFF
jgi:hypothetical protein